jgi:hypothetical protein
VFGTRIAETILASVHVRARKQAGHMDASDLIRALPKITLRGGGRPHMESGHSHPELILQFPVENRFGLLKGCQSTHSAIQSS